MKKKTAKIAMKIWSGCCRWDAISIKKEPIKIRDWGFCQPWGTKIQPNREKKDHYTPTEVAIEFWTRWYQETDNIRKEELEASNIGASTKNSLCDYIKKVDDIGRPLPLGNIDVDFLKFNYLQKPSVDWDKVKVCLSDFNMDDIAVESFVFAIMRGPIDYITNPSNNPFIKVFNDAENEVVSGIKQQIKKLSPLVKRLENLREGSLLYRDSAPISATIEELKLDLAVHKEIIKLKDNSDKAKLNFYGIDKDLKKSPQKHNYWNHVVSFAVKKLNEYCHNGNCTNKCRKTHQKAITKVAELLKILYPTIWKEDIPTIANRIKQKDHRGIK